jgi:hypothetical protein
MGQVINRKLLLIEVNINMMMLTIHTANAAAPIPVAASPHLVHTKAVN